METQFNSQFADGAEKAKDYASQVFSDMNIDPQAQIGALKETVSTAAEATAELIRKYPLQSLVGAVALGFIVGTLVTKKK